MKYLKAVTQLTYWPFILLALIIAAFVLPILIINHTKGPKDGKDHSTAAVYYEPGK